MNWMCLSYIFIGTHVVGSKTESQSHFFCSTGVKISFYFQTINVDKMPIYPLKSYKETKSFKVSCSVNAYRLPRHPHYFQFPAV